MTDPKNTEDQELSLDQLKDAAGGFRVVAQVTAPESIKVKKNNVSSGGCGGEDKLNVSVSANPGGDDV